MGNFRFHISMFGSFAQIRKFPLLALLAAFSLSSMNARANTSALSPSGRMAKPAHFFVIDGTYGFDEGGEMYFSPSRKAQKLLPHYPASEKTSIGFSDSNMAVSMFGLEEYIGKIDLHAVCAVRGRARIAVSTVTYGEGPSHSWYTVKLERLIWRSPAQLVPCQPTR